MQLPCYVVRDLLPLYAEKLTEEETTKLVETHLENCPQCRAHLAQIDTNPQDHVASAKPMEALKKEIRRRRIYAAAIAALIVFIVTYTVFYHESAWRVVPWEEGLVQVTGVEERLYSTVYAHEETLEGEREGKVEALILQVDSRVNGIHEQVFTEEDGTQTTILQGSTNNHRSNFVREYSEMAICPVPDRLIYDGGEEQKLLWGEALPGGVRMLPRLALSYYGILAALLAAFSGILWLMFRRQEKSWVARQVFFAPISYLAAHVLIKGGRSASEFLEHDLTAILLLAAAIYALLTLLWQVFLRRRKEA